MCKRERPFFKAAASFISTPVGLHSEEGWLCTSITDVANDSMAYFAIMRTSTLVDCKPPSQIFTYPIADQTGFNKMINTL